MSALENWMLVNVSLEPEYKIRVGHCYKAKWQAVLALHHALMLISRSKVSSVLYL